MQNRELQNGSPKNIDDQVLLDSSVFCLAPWIHLHVWPKGEVSPCCWSSSHRDQVFDQLSEGNSLQTIWNSQEIRSLRLRMLAEQPSKSHCYRCYDLEKSGSTSLRQKINKDFKSHLPSVKETRPDGTLEKFHMPYVDIRFSNLCNFKCRTCGPDLSSAWAAEKKMTGVQKITHFYPSLLAELFQNLASVEEIYFAGGEPLIMEEHSLILAELIKRGLTHVRLRYNTNFSILKFKDISFLEIWKQFPNVHIGASIDGSEQRGEYIRKGTHWEKIVENRVRLKTECPHIYFNIESTISTFNAWHISDFLRQWIERGLIEPNRFYANLLQHPDILNIQILPKKFKDEVSAKLLNFIDWLNQNYAKSSDSTIRSCQSIIHFMNEKENETLWLQFKSQMTQLDTIRGENLRSVFPELPL